MDKRKTIFIIDDNQIFIKSFCNLIAENSFYKIVGIADNAEIGLKLIIQSQPDLIIIEISIPEMGGIRMIKKLHSIKEKPKIILVSFHNSEEYIKMANSVKADAFIWKGDISEKLFPTINSMFSKEIHLLKRKRGKERLILSKNNHF
jgi:DNA-binding NarL/FixJ family response regulator